MSTLKSLLITFVLALAAAMPIKGADHFFPYPSPPEDLTTLSQRTNYLVEHFWERCDLKNAFAQRDKLAEAFRDYVSFMPYASADTVHASINALIAKVQKDPKNLLTLGQIAQDALYGDSAELLSDEVYLPFAKAVAANKKIPGASKARFAHHAKVLANSQIGATIPNLTLTMGDGSKSHLHDINAPYIILFVNDPECDDCRLAKARLAANHHAARLLKSGDIAIVSVLPDEPDEQWREALPSYPKEWVVGAVPDLDEIIDLRHPPVIYFLNGVDKTVLFKNIQMGNLLSALELMPSSNTPEP